MQPIQASRFKQAEFERTVYVVTPEAGVPYEDLLQASCWAHVGAQLRPWDRIEVRPEDGAYFAELMVLNAGRLWAKVVELRKVDLDSGAPAEEPVDGYIVGWSGPASKFRVLRVSDKQVLQKGFSSKPEAQAWLDDHLKATA